MSRIKTSKSTTSSSSDGLKKIVFKDYFFAARLISEFLTLEMELRKVRYLSPFAQAPSIAHQVTGVILIGNALSELVIKKDENFSKSLVLELLLWHDAPETRTGDISRDQKKYVTIDEDKARKHMFGTFSWGEEIIDLIEKFEDGTDQLEFKIAKDADALYVVYTIKSLLDQDVIINHPDDRINKTLKRLLTEEGIALGREMATRNSEEIAQLLWKYSLKKEYSHKLTKSLPEESLATKMVIAWCLSEMESEKSRKKRFELLEKLLQQGSDKDFEDRQIEDINKLYKIIDLKRDNLKNPIKDFDEQIEELIKSLTIFESRSLGIALMETDLYDWWNIMMEYARVGSNGKVVYASDY